MQQVRSAQKRRTIKNSEQAAVVLHITQALRGGGEQTFVRELIPGLLRRGIDARVLCAYGDSRLTAAESEAWIGRIYCLERSGVPRLRYLNQMRRLVREIAPTIVHTHGHVGGTWGRIAAVLEKVPIIIHTEHVSRDALRGLERVAHSFLNRRTNLTVMFSERTAEIVKRREKIYKPYITPNGIRIRPAPTQADRNAARQRLGIDVNHIALGLIANLEAHKNPALAIEAIAYLPAQTRSVLRLALFGDGTLRETLAARAEELGMRDTVRFYGFRDDLIELLPGLDAVLSTSAREMMPMSLLEAMNAALPIVGVPHAGTLDLVVNGETGIVLESWDVRALAEAVGWVAEHPEWRVRAGNAAYNHLKKNFDIEIITDRYVELYWALLDRNSADL